MPGTAAAQAVPPDPRHASRMDMFRARNQAYKGFVADHSSKLCLILFIGMGCTAPPDEFERACRRRLSSEPGSAQFEWEPIMSERRLHRGRVAVGFDSPSLCAQARQDLEKWTWKNHPIGMEDAATTLITKRKKKKRRNRHCGAANPLPSSTGHAASGCPKNPLSNQTTNNTAVAVFPALPLAENSAKKSPAAQEEAFLPTSKRANHSSADQTIDCDSTANPTPAQTKKDANLIRPPPKHPFHPRTVEIIDLTNDPSPPSSSPARQPMTTAALVNVPCAAAAAMDEAAGVAAGAAAYADTALKDASEATFRLFEAEMAGDAEAAAAARKDLVAADQRASAAYGAAATAARIAAAYSSSISLGKSCYRY
ncbi:hypothetical protein IF1G_07414 [Cordyceps javanica]|uniref:Uncharacterized protein n=1 Tax=Cordyceps javanica TaxID=43265 RepID=A0A545VKR9_9HYPO|nr:hypothetical protein IF1G_07414 [Cordyceps javanica]TQW02305.1 hypothetical protein IF2G_10108 [Cordyceps javanica]